MDKTVAFILAGGIGQRLSLLTRYRAKPAVPFAGRYRIIDFTLTNCVRSGIDEIHVLTQYISRSLIKHIGIGKPWGLDRLEGGVRILHPHLGYQAADWYRGTADALYQNISVLEELDCTRIMILSGDHVYRMNYGEFLDFHERSGKPVSLSVAEVPASLCREFGIATVNTDGTIRKFEEKPMHTKSRLASMGIYIFEKDFLISIVRELEASFDNLDFGKHVIPHLVEKGLVSAFAFAGYWLDIGTLRSYYKASLELLAERPRLQLYGDPPAILTVPDDNPPLVIMKHGAVRRSLISNGCVISGAVDSSILSPGVRIERGARVVGSIILNNCVIGRDAEIRNVIMDKSVSVGSGTRIGTGEARVANKLKPAFLDTGITLIGTGTKIPSRMEIGTNCLVSGSRRTRSIPRRDIEDGGYYIAREERF